jgi:hypothetical protein
MVAESAISSSFGRRRVSTRNRLPDSWTTVSTEKREPLGAFSPNRTVRPGFAAGSGLSPRRGKKRRVLAGALIIVSSIAIGYAALGAIRSHTRNSASAGERPATTTLTPMIDQSLLTVDVGDQPSMSPTVEPPPPAEGGDQAASPAPAGTATAKSRAHSRKHKPRMRSDRSSTGKTSELLRKYL